MLDAQATADSGGGYNLGWMASDERLDYTVNVATTGLYTSNLRTASASAGGSLRIREAADFDESGTVGAKPCPCGSRYRSPIREESDSMKVRGSNSLFALVWAAVVCFAVGQAGYGLATARAEQPARLNVLFIAVDDLNTRLGCYGYEVKTPNIDRLARMGRKFDHAYGQYPLCNPSRTSLMSGWRPEKTKVWGNGEAPRAHLKGAVPLQEHFQANGYFTARVGKIYHGRFEHEFKWDVVDGIEDSPAERPARSSAMSQPRARSPQENPPREKQSTQPSPEQAVERPGTAGMLITWQATDRPDQDEPDGRTARRVVEIIKQNKDRAFFIAAGFQRPHLPWVAPRKYFELYPFETIQLPASPANDLEDIPAPALTQTAKAPSTADQRREAVAAYHACVSFMDAQVGVLLDALDQLNLWDRTIVVFWGDNGFHLGEHGLWRKTTLFEESTHVPLILVPPHIAQPGVATKHSAELVDLYPTLVELCGLPQVDGLEGTSLVPLLNDPSRAVKSAAFTVVARGRSGLGRSVRTEAYRYTEWPDGSAELYDHRADPHEYNNLAKNPQHAGRLEEMKNLLQAGYKAALLPR